MAVPYTKDWTSLSKINPELEALLPTLGGFKFIGPDTTLESLRALEANRPPSEPWPEVLEHDIQIPVRDGTSNRARVYSPANPTSEGKALLVLAFGGGFVMGKLEGEERNCRTWVKNFGGVAVSISYRLCPEHVWPGSVEDVFDAVKWIAAHANDLGADPSKGFVVGGTSSGATATITVSHLWRDEGLTPPLTGLHLAVPAPCIISALPQKYREKEKSWEQNKDAPTFNRDTSNFLAQHAKPKPDDPMRSPLLFTTGHENLPPAYFAIGGADPWRDSGLIYEEVLREECGVKTKVDIFPGLPHGFWAAFPAAGFSKEFRGKSDEGLAWLFHQCDYRQN
ncbi:related to Putative sterigmatocystin biosynthesis lipase/esterase STCI [Phialocephala subalpina]|uniref:Related to Putative sterigmatocystin biosynthesis lipase/esterase STCI n=1 Tax=Phialocephala subalpina TaxID=576137 RepID=A0A1L7XCN4_9HELO|nr:related to Putative sterigmatocystin biosynthesis lipase/esterase STCI [Phialocephala subalpina]